MKEKQEKSWKLSIRKKIIFLYKKDDFLVEINQQHFLEKWRFSLAL